MDQMMDESIDRIAEKIAVALADGIVTAAKDRAAMTGETISDAANAIIAEAARQAGREMAERQAKDN